MRQERRADRPAVDDVVERAFAPVSYSDHREHLMVAALRETSAFIPELSLLAEADGSIVGHILLTRVAIHDADTATDALALAPLSVVPERQRHGVGSSLVHAAHERAAAFGFGVIVLVGIPGYYERFGYEPLDTYPITLPVDVPVRNRMVLALRADALVGVRGKVIYPPVWWAH